MPICHGVLLFDCIIHEVCPRKFQGWWRPADADPKAVCPELLGIYRVGQKCLNVLEILFYKLLIYRSPVTSGINIC